MKLVSCYIKAFGKLENKEYNFSENLNSICEDNGQGKSTLAAFIRAMLFGLPKTTNKSFEREHYLPFSGKGCGGNLVFKKAKNTYRIERTFGKSPKGDECKVFVNDKLDTSFKDEIGSQLLDIDLESFNRMLFIDANDLEILSTSTINSKMSHYIEDTDDDFDLEKVIKKLDDKCKDIIPLKSKDTKGEIASLRMEINSLETDIHNYQLIKDSLDSKYERLNDLQTAYKEKAKELQNASSVNEILECFNQLEAYVNELKDEEDKLKAILNKYPNGLALKEEINQLEDNYNKYLDLNKEIKSLELSSEEENEFKEYSKMFKNKIPSTIELDEISSLINAYNSKTLISDNLSDDNKKILSKFNNNYPSQNDLNELENDFKLYTELNAKLIDQVSINTNVVNENKKSNNFMILLIISIIITFGGIILGILIKPILTLISLVGLVLFVLSIIPVLKQGKNSNLNFNNQRNELKEKVENLKNKINTYLMPYGFSSYKNGSIEIAYSLFKNELEEYAKINKALEDYNRIKKEEETKKKELQNKLNEIFKIYNLDNIDYSNALLKIKLGLSRYEVLKVKIDKINNDLIKYNNLINECKSYIDSFVSKYNLVSYDDIIFYIQEYNKDLTLIDSYSANIKAKQKRNENYKLNKNLVSKPSNLEKVDIESLTNKLSELSGAIKKIETEINADELEVEKIDYKKDQVIELKDKVKELEEQYFILNKTKELLQEAEKSLKDKYILPVKEKFCKYATSLEKSIGEKVLINSNYELSFEREGIQRDYRHLSSGQLSLAALCYRLALIDNVFESSNPFIIIDDLFVTLDETHLEKAKDLLKELAKDRQIIYFTCHSSRDIK